MNVRKIREDLGRARTCVQRRDFVRALYLLCISLRDIGTQAAPTPLRGDFRSVISDICADPFYRETGAQVVSYQPGKERDLLLFFNKIYKQITNKEDKEDYETAMQRKLNLDRCINNGKSFLSQQKFSDADDCFIEAFKYYKNEFAAFAIMARAMMDANQFVRAYGYIRKGLAERPNDQTLLRLAVECNKNRPEK